MYCTNEQDLTFDLDQSDIMRDLGSAMEFTDQPQAVDEHLSPSSRLRMAAGRQSYMNVSLPALCLFLPSVRIAGQRTIPNTVRRT
jgi:hypothetical protein